MIKTHGEESVVWITLQSNTSAGNRNVITRSRDLHWKNYLFSCLTGTVLLFVIRFLWINLPFSFPFWLRYVSLDTVDASAAVKSVEPPFQKLVMKSCPHFAVSQNVQEEYKHALLKGSK